MSHDIERREYVCQRDELIANKHCWLGKFEPVRDLVRCKDCKYKDDACVKTGKDNYCNLMHCFHSDDWFCADGERR